MSKATGNPREHVRVHVKADTSHLSSDDLAILHILAKAVDIVNRIYLQQRNQDMEETKGVFDKSRGVDFYPPGMTVEEMNSYLAISPKMRDKLLSPFTVVQKHGKRLSAVPYSKAYMLEAYKISRLLNQAAEICPYPLFKEFLIKRALAFTTNSYRESDIAWIHANDAPFDLTIGPMEDYEDRLFGVKRTFEGMLGITLQDKTAEAEMFQAEVPAFDAMLGDLYGYSARTVLTPMIVTDEILASGMSVYEYVPMAFNLPNDPDIHESAGSKKIFNRNVMALKFDRITSMIARRVLDPSLLSIMEFEPFFNFVVGHESSHGISFRFDGEHFRELGSPFEEAKADAFGLIFLYFLADRGLIGRNMPDQAVMIHLVDSLRQVRFGTEKAHAIGALIQYNHFVWSGALHFEHGEFRFSPEHFRGALQDLGDQLFELSQKRDRPYETAKEMMDVYREAPQGILDAISKLDGIPVDIDPIFFMKP